MNDNDGLNYKINVTENLVATFQKINKTVINTINTLEIFKDIRLDSTINGVNNLDKSFSSLSGRMNNTAKALNDFVSNINVNNLSPISEKFKNTTNKMQKLNQELQRFEKLNLRISKQPNLLQTIFGGTTSFAGYSINFTHLARQLIAFVNKSFEASRNQANAELQINVVLNNKGLWKQFNEIKKKAEELQSAGIFRNDVILAGASRLSTYLSTTEAITKMMGILANYATGMSGGKAVDAQQMIAYATTLTRMLNGSLFELSRTNLKMSEAQKAILKGKATEAQYVQVLGENYKNLSKEMMKVEVIGQVINKSWKDLYTTMSDTPFGKWEQLKNAFTNIIKEVGNRLIPAVNAFFDVILKNIPLIKEGFLGFAELLSSFIGTISIITEGIFNLFSFISSFLDLIPKPLLSIIGIIMAIVISVQVLMGVVALFSVLWASLSNPIVLAIAAIVVGISLVINYLNKTQNKTISVLGVIAGVIYALWTILKNVIGWVLDLFKPFIEYLVNCWGNPEKAFEAFCSNLSAFIVDTCATIVQWVGTACVQITNILIGWFDNLASGLLSNPLTALIGLQFVPGLLLTKSTLNKLKEGNQKVIDDVVSDMRATAQHHRGNAEKISADNDLLTIPRIPQKDIGEAYQEAYDWAAKFTDNFGQKMKGIEDNIYDDDDINDLVNNTGSMAKTADNINDKLNVMEDDLKYLRDFAEREIINNHITSDVNVEMINNNNISSELDIDGVLNSLTRKLDEQLRIQANGIYNY